MRKNEKRRKWGEEEEAGFAQMGKIEEEQINKLKKEEIGKGKRRGLCTDGKTDKIEEK